MLGTTIPKIDFPIGAKVMVVGKTQVTGEIISVVDKNAKVKTGERIITVPVENLIRLDRPKNIQMEGIPF